MSLIKDVSPLSVAIVFDQQLVAGGGYQQSLTTVLSLAQTPDSEFRFIIFTTHVDNVQYLKSLGLNVVYLHLPKWRHFILTFRRLLRWYPLYRYIREFLGPNYLESRFEAFNVDLVYFTSPSYIAHDLDRLNYLFTVWDLCHIDEPVFPEVRNDGQFEFREHLYTQVLPKAFAIFVDSEITKNKLAAYYRVPLSRIYVQHFSPSTTVREYIQPSTTCNSSIRAKYNINFDYIFYPAQLWPHKNHVFILEGLRLLEDHFSIRLGAVFAGGSINQNNYSHILSQSLYLGLSDRVRFLGFVPNLDIPYLYLDSIALVMPTYFGPTNIPPLEALSLNVPIVYSANLEQFQDLCDSVYKIDLSDPMTLALTLAKLADCRSFCISEAKAVNSNIKIADQSNISQNLHKILLDFAIRRRCWSR